MDPRCNKFTTNQGKETAVLITGGFGYIGSHLLERLLDEGFICVVIDNFITSCKTTEQTLKEEFSENLVSYDADFSDSSVLTEIFQNYNIDVVVHLAAYKSAPDSFSKILGYYENNVSKTYGLLLEMEKAGVTNIIYSSTGAVYGDPSKAEPLTEASSVNPVSPYGQTKLDIERCLLYLFDNSDSWNGLILRYFNPVGRSKLLARQFLPTLEDTVFGSLAKVVKRSDHSFSVYGYDYPTPDGSPVRDFIHIDDIVEGHLLGVRRMLESERLRSNYLVNLGSGTGNSILQMLEIYQDINGYMIDIENADRRVGDIGYSVASIDLARSFLMWSPKYSLRDICRLEYIDTISN